MCFFVVFIGDKCREKNEREKFFLLVLPNIVSSSKMLKKMLL